MIPAEDAQCFFCDIVWKIGHILVSGLSSGGTVTVYLFLHPKSHCLKNSGMRPPITLQRSGLEFLAPFPRHSTLGVGGLIEIRISPPGESRTPVRAPHPFPHHRAPNSPLDRSVSDSPYAATDAPSPQDGAPSPPHHLSFSAFGRSVSIFLRKFFVRTVVSSFQPHPQFDTMGLGF